MAPGLRSAWRGRDLHHGGKTDPQGGRVGTAYYLGEKAALKVVAKSEAPGLSW